MNYFLVIYLGIAGTIFVLAEESARRKRFFVGQVWKWYLNDLAWMAVAALFWPLALAALCYTKRKVK